LPSQPLPEFLVHVAENVRVRRVAAGLSQKALAQASGISLRMIGAIENRSSSVSTSTLDRIGLALGSSLAELVSDPKAASASPSRRLGWKGKRGGTGVLLSSVRAMREVETWEWKLQPGERYRAGADPQGWHVLLIVISGRLTLATDGDEQVIEANAHLFASHRPHTFINAGRALVRFFRLTIC
jgi:transcriptional regulator with XRE-family HTH domain